MGEIFSSKMITLETRYVVIPLASEPSLNIEEELLNLKVLMESYYDILEINSKASPQEIKAAYRSLCQEYHPDKLPPGTPEKARRYVEDRFKKINEAYSVLSSLEKRRVYDQSSQDSDSKNNMKDSSNRSYTVLDPMQIQKTIQRLENQKSIIEIEYQKAINTIDQSLCRKLSILGYRKEYLPRRTIWAKSLIFLFSTGIVVLCFWHNNIFGIFGFLLAFLSVVYTIFIIFSPTIKLRDIKRVKSIENKARYDKNKAHESKIHKLNEFTNHQKRRVAYFKPILNNDLSEEYIKTLCHEDQAYLMIALQEKQESQKLQNILMVVTIIATIIRVFALFSGYSSGTHDRNY